MEPTEGVSGAEHYQRGREYYQKNDFDNALPEFVRAIQMSPSLTQSTEIIGEWHDCMMFCLKFNQHWLPLLKSNEKSFQQICEAIYAHLKNSNYQDAERYCQEALAELPDTEQQKCHASILAERAMALFGMILDDYQKNPERASERMLSAIGAQIKALSIDPEVKLTYRMRPYVRK